MARTILFILLLYQSGWAQVIPADRRSDWSGAGLSDQYSEIEVVVSLEEFGGKGDGHTSNNRAIEDAQQWLDHKGGIIQLDSGMYVFDRSVILDDGIVLRGKGVKNTGIRFIAPASGDLIQIKGEMKDTAMTLSLTANKGTDWLELSSTMGLKPGDYIRLMMEDTDLVTSSWAKNTVGQIVQIRAVGKDTIYLNEALRMDYPVERHPKAIRIIPRRGVRIECMRIIRGVNDDFQSSTILMEYAADCSISGVEMDSCNFSHVNITSSTHCEVRNSYFHDAFDYGGGGKGYGVMIQATSGDCLVENNVFRHLRHSMILQSGANGNVFGYNYSIEPYWTGVSLPADAAGDLVLHGNYPYANLFEGNIGQQIVIDDSHGVNGPFNTFFRNRLGLYGIFMNNNPPTDYVNLVGNEVTNTGVLLGLYLIAGNNHIQYGNNIKNKIYPTGTEVLTDTSLYLSYKPDFMQQQVNFPAIGYPNEYNTGKIAAQLNFLAGYPAYCPGDSLTNELQSIGKASHFYIFPNPATDIVSFRLPCNGNGNISVMIYSLQGNLMMSQNIHRDDTSVSVAGLVPGIYRIVVLCGKDIFAGRLLKL